MIGDEADKARSDLMTIVRGKDIRMVQTGEDGVGLPWELARPGGLEANAGAGLVNHGRAGVLDEGNARPPGKGDGHSKSGGGGRTAGPMGKVWAWVFGGSGGRGWLGRRALLLRVARSSVWASSWTRLRGRPSADFTRSIRGVLLQDTCSSRRRSFAALLGRRSPGFLLDRVPRSTGSRVVCGSIRSSARSNSSRGEEVRPSDVVRARPNSNPIAFEQRRHQRSERSCRWQALISPCSKWGLRPVAVDRHEDTRPWPGAGIRQEPIRQGPGPGGPGLGILRIR